MKLNQVLYLFISVIAFSCSTREGANDQLPLNTGIDAGLLKDNSLNFFEEELSDNSPLLLLLRRSRFYYENAQYGEALEDIYRILNRDSENPSTYTLKALIHYKLGSYDEANKAANLAESLGDQSKDLFYIKTLLLAAKGEVDLASNYMVNALAMAPYSGEIWWANGQLNFAKGDSSEAVESFQKAIGFDPEATYIYKDLISAYLGVSEVDSALYYTQKAIDNVADNEGFKMKKAAILEQVGNLDSALVVYKSVYEADKSRLEVLTQIGNLYFKKKRFGNAFANYVEVLKKLPGNANMQYLAGLCQERMGYYGTAQTYYVKARTNQPENELYNKAFERARFLQERKIQRQLSVAVPAEPEPEVIQRRSFSIDPIDSKKKVIIDKNND